MPNGLNRSELLAQERAEKAAQAARDAGKPIEEEDTTRLNPKWPYRMIEFPAEQLLGDG